MAAMGQDGLRGLSATTCRWLLHLDCLRSTELNGRYSATKSTAEISVSGHYLPLPVTFELVASCGAERPVFGEQFEGGNFSNRPQPAGHLFSEAAVQWTASLQKLPDTLREQFGQSRPWASDRNQAAMRLLPATQLLAVINSRFRYRRWTAPDPEPTFVSQACRRRITELRPLCSIVTPDNRGYRE